MLQEALRLEPLHLRAQVDLGVALMRSGDAEGAEAALGLLHTAHVTNFAVGINTARDSQLDMYAGFMLEEDAPLVVSSLAAACQLACADPLRIHPLATSPELCRRCAFWCAVSRHCARSGSQLCLAV